LGVDGLGIANEAPSATFDPDGFPRLTLPMVARLQGFPDTWKFTGKKTAAYRQTGNAFPPPVARAVGLSIIGAFERRSKPKGLELELRFLEKSPKYGHPCQSKARKR